MDHPTSVCESGITKVAAFVKKFFVGVLRYGDADSSSTSSQEMYDSFCAACQHFGCSLLPPQLFRQFVPNIVQAPYEVLSEGRLLFKGVSIQPLTDSSLNVLKTLVNPELVAFFKEIADSGIDVDQSTTSEAESDFLPRDVDEPDQKLVDAGEAGLSEDGEDTSDYNGSSFLISKGEDDEPAKFGKLSPFISGVNQVLVVNWVINVFSKALVGNITFHEDTTNRHYAFVVLQFCEGVTKGVVSPKRKVNLCFDTRKISFEYLDSLPIEPPLAPQDLRDEVNSAKKEKVVEKTEKERKPESLRRSSSEDSRTSKKEEKSNRDEAKESRGSEKEKRRSAGRGDRGGEKPKTSDNREDKRDHRSRREEGDARTGSREAERAWEGDRRRDGDRALREMRRSESDSSRRSSGDSRLHDSRFKSGSEGHRSHRSPQRSRLESKSRDGREHRDEGRDTRGDSRMGHRDLRGGELRHDGRDVRVGDGRDLRYEIRDLRGDGKGVEARDLRHELRDLRGDPKVADSRDLRLELRDLRAGELRHDPRDYRGDGRSARDLRVDGRDGRNDLRDVRVEARSERDRDFREARAVREFEGRDLRDSRDPREIGRERSLRDVVRDSSRDVRPAREAAAEGREYWEREARLRGYDTGVAPMRGPLRSGSAPEDGSGIKRPREEFERMDPGGRSFDRREGGYPEDFRDFERARDSKLGREMILRSSSEAERRGLYEERDAVRRREGERFEDVDSKRYSREGFLDRERDPAFFDERRRYVEERRLDDVRFPEELRRMEELRAEDRRQEDRRSLDERRLREELYDQPKGHVRSLHDLPPDVQRLVCNGSAVRLFTFQIILSSLKLFPRWLPFLFFLLPLLLFLQHPMGQSLWKVIPVQGLVLPTRTR